MRPEIFLLDVDGTLTKEVCWTPQDCQEATPDQEMIDYVNKLYATNCIVIRTARRHALYMATIEWLARNGVEYHFVSFNNPPGKPIDRDAINKPS